MDDPASQDSRLSAGLIIQGISLHDLKKFQV